MKKQPIAVLFFLSTLFSSMLLAQKPPVTYGKLTEEDTKMKVYDKDSTAPAVVLCDFGNVYFSYESNHGIVQHFEIIRRIKIFKKEGYKYADVSIPYFQNKNGRQVVEDLKAHCYNEENGKIVETKMEKDGVFEVKIDKKHRLKKFTIPQVKEGSFIEYKYTINSDFIANIPSWAFQENIPVRYSEFRLQVPEFMTFTKISQGVMPNSFSDAKPGISKDLGDYSVMDYKWVQLDIPKIEEEPFIGTTDNFISKIDFQIKQIAFHGEEPHDYTNTWQKMSSEFWEDEDFGDAIHTKKGIEKLVEPLVASLSDEKEKMKAIYQFVSHSFKSDEDYESPFMKQSMGDLLESQKGTPAEINILLLAMLRNAGLQAFPVIISTRSHGKINTLYPVLERFDHVIACVLSGNEKIMIDANDPLRPLGLLPEEAMNGDGILLKEKDLFEIIPIQNTVKSTVYINATIQVQPDGSLDEQFQINQKGYFALDDRSKLQSEKLEDRLKAILKEELEDGALLESKIENESDIDQTLIYNCSLKSKSFVQVNEPNIYLTPFLSFGQNINPFKSETRKFPVDFGYGYDEVYVFTIKFPDGFKLSENPKSKRLHWEDGSLKSDYIVEPGEKEIKITSKFTLKRTSYETSDYQQLRDYFSQLVNKHAEQIVLTKQ